MSTIASEIISLTIVYSTIYSGADQSKHQSSASLAFVWRIHRGPLNSPHKWPVTRKKFPFDDVIMEILLIGPLETNFSQIPIGIIHFHSRKCIWKCRLENGGHLSDDLVTEPEFDEPTGFSGNHKKNTLYLFQLWFAIVFWCLLHLEMDLLLLLLLLLLLCLLQLRFRKE